MKIKLLIVFAVVFTLFSFKKDKKAESLNGTWKLVSKEFVQNGGGMKITYDDEKNGGQLKTWSNKYFMFVGREVSGSRVINSFGGGTYERSGKEYVEHIQYHSVIGLTGQDFRSLVEVKGKTLTVIYPVDQEFRYDVNNCSIEKYIRVD